MTSAFSARHFYYVTRSFPPCQTDISRFVVLHPTLRILLLVRLHDDARRFRRSFLSWETADRPIAASRLSARLLPASELYPVGSAFATPFPECSAPPDPQSRSAFPPRAWRPFSARLSGLPRAERKLRGRPGEGKSGFITGSDEPPATLLGTAEDAGHLNVPECQAWMSPGTVPGCSPSRRCSASSGRSGRW